MKLVLFADGAVGQEIASYLMKNYISDLSLIVTVSINDIHREAEEQGVAVCVFDNEEMILNRLGSGIDLGVMAWWPKILKKPLLNAPRRGFVNTHPSLLPYNRGKHYNFWALVEQVPFGVTIHRVDSGVDTGPIIAQSILSYSWLDTGETLYFKARKAMVALFCETYSRLRTGEYEEKPQIHSLGSFHLASELEQASKINLDDDYRARDLLNLLRARTFEGYPGCWFEEAGSRYEISVKIRKVK